jgi:hypothetical protein
MSDDMPWVIGLTDEEVQELRNNKQQLTQYGQEKIRELMKNQEPYPDAMFEEAERREAENKALEALDKLHEENGKGMKQLAEHERIEVISTAVGAIRKYSDALKALAETEKEELQAELEAKKKENFQMLADACMAEYEKKYNRDTFPVDEHWVYMVGEYFGTGEGQTVCVMMTQANPGHKEDFENSTNKYVACTTQQYRAVRAFHEQFGTWYLHGLRFLSKEDFFGEYSYYIPPAMMKLLNRSCFKDFYTRVHYNFS